MTTESVASVWKKAAVQRSHGLSGLPCARTLRSNAPTSESPQRMRWSRKVEGFAGLASTRLCARPSRQNPPALSQTAGQLVFFIQDGRQTGFPKTPTRPNSATAALAPVIAPFRRLRFVTIEKRPTVTRKCRLTVGTACPPPGAKDFGLTRSQSHQKTLRQPQE